MQPLRRSLLFTLTLIALSFAFLSINACTKHSVRLHPKMW